MRHGFDANVTFCNFSRSNSVKERGSGGRGSTFLAAELTSFGPGTKQKWEFRTSKGNSAISSARSSKCRRCSLMFPHSRLSYLPKAKQQTKNQNRCSACGGAHAMAVPAKTRTLARAAHRLDPTQKRTLTGDW